MASNSTDQIERLCQHHTIKIGEEAMKDWIISAAPYSDADVESAVDELVYNFKKDKYKTKPDIQDFRKALSMTASAVKNYKQTSKKKSREEFTKEAFDLWLSNNAWAKGEGMKAVRSVAHCYIEALIRTQSEACAFYLPFVIYKHLEALLEANREEIDKQGFAICKRNLQNGFMDAEVRTRETRKKWFFVPAPFEIENYNITIPSSIWQRMGVKQQKHTDIFAGADELIGSVYA